MLTAVRVSRINVSNKSEFGLRFVGAWSFLVKTALRTVFQSISSRLERERERERESLEKSIRTVCKHNRLLPYFIQINRTHWH